MDPNKENTPLINGDSHMDETPFTLSELDAVTLYFLNLRQQSSWTRWLLLRTSQMAFPPKPDIPLGTLQ